MDDNSTEEQVHTGVPIARYRGIWSNHLNGILGEEGPFQLAEVYHRGIWSIHLSGPSGEESHVLGCFSQTCLFCFFFFFLSKVGIRGSWYTYERCLLKNRGFRGCENPLWAKPF